MAEDNAAGGASGFDPKSFLDQVRADITKQSREALKAKIKNLMVKRNEAVRSVALIDEEIEREIALFQKGLG